ncbi:MAG: hypothetical protein COA42_24355 [Alteromonadaceae bacterium]|nr:MAG: hypothetical protein COA42_24355 [Alteromonadaceae bacterium]
MSGHRAATIDRIKKEPVVLIPQDTTFFNFATESEKKNMGTLRTKDSNQQLLHTSIAITPSKINLGIVDANMWQRPEEEKSKKAKDKARREKPIEEKESMRWITHYDTACNIQERFPNTTVISVADREGDIHEWFQHAENTPENMRAGYIIRAKTNRKLDIDVGETKPLWDYMNGLKTLGQYELNIPKRNGEEGRDAVIDVCSSEVRLLGRGKTRKPISLYVVYAKERHPPDGKKGVEWMLLTDLAVEGFDQARIIIEWYRCRWEIETYFRVLKGGCSVEKSRLRTAERLLNYIAVNMIIAWRLQSVTMIARREPDLPCTEVFSEKEWRTIWIMKKKEAPPNDTPTLREVTRMLAQIGGFLARKGDGDPGVKTIWQGYDKLLHYIDAIDLAKKFG